VTKRVKRMFAWLKTLLKRIYQYFEGAYRIGQLEDAQSLTRTDAEKAVHRVIRESGLPPDCVGATVVRGGSAILVMHTKTAKNGEVKKQQEAFVHNTYDEAATEALKWIQNQEKVSVGSQSGYNRAERRSFAARQKKAAKASAKRPN